MSELEIFRSDEFGEVRTIVIDGTPWFVGKDVAEALGYVKARNAIASHVQDEDKKDAPIQGTLGGTQQMTIINESGLYSLILSSKLPTAKKFKHWVTSEVLPTIRKHGAYMTEQTLEKALTSPDFLIKLATQLKEEQEARILAEQKIEQQKPLVEFAHKVSATTNVIDMGKMAKLLKDEHINIGRNRLFQWLRQKEILMSNNIPYQRYINAGYFEVKESTYETPFGSKTQQTTYVTGKGQIYITEKIRRDFSENIA